MFVVPGRPYRHVSSEQALPNFLHKKFRQACAWSSFTIDRDDFAWKYKTFICKFTAVGSVAGALVDADSWEHCYRNSRRWHNRAIFISTLCHMVIETRFQWSMQNVFISMLLNCANHSLLCAHDCCVLTSEGFFALVTNCCQQFVV